MGTTETYIKMADCPEIQKGHVFVVGDYCKAGRQGVGLITQFNKAISRVYINNNYIGMHTRAAIWLPRQGQLQEMTDWCWTYFDKLCAEYGLEYAKRMNPDKDWKIFSEVFWQVCSKEIAGLLVVMKEKYNKVWSGEMWEKAHQD